jgi:hypothetical protein
MSQSENKIPLPPGWAEDHLSEFLQASFKHILASFVHKKRKFNLLLKVDEVYRGLGGNLDNFEDPFAPTFLHRSHSSFIASCRLSMSGQVAETFPQLRTCLEYALYALHMNKNPSLSKVWVRRHMNKESRKESRQSFSHGNVNKSLKPTVTRVTPFAEMANPAPRYGGLVPPLNMSAPYNKPST